MFVAPNLFKLCATALLVLSSFIVFTTSNIAIAAPNANVTDLQHESHSEQELEGELEVLYEDYEDHSKSRLRHFLKTSNGRVELHLPNNAKTNALQSGAKVRARGRLFKNSDEMFDLLAVTDDQNSLVVAALDSSTTTTSIASATSAVLPNTFGEQRTLVLLVNFQDNANEQPWTVEQVQSMVFGTVSDFYKENSNGQTWLSGDVHGYLTLAINETCDFGTMDSYAQKAAIDSGIDVGSYNRLVYLFPSNSACGWRGQGTVGGTPSRSWINGELNLFTIGHELGHNFGLHHAKYIGCSDGNISDSCATLEYGDNLDVMGNSYGHFNVFNKERLGWLRPELGEIVTADSEGSYIIDPYESIFSGTAKGLKVRRGTDAVTGQALWYYLEYRQALGFDSFLAGKSVTNGVLFHLNLAGNDNSHLMDMTPNSNIYDLDDAALVAGSSYSDSDAGVTITTEWADETGASVYISFSDLACNPSNPMITVIANETTVIAGSSTSYSATVINNDSKGCAASDFDVSANVPVGWMATNATLNLEPGANGLVTINIASESTESDGVYDIAFSAENSSDGNYKNSYVVSYVIDTPVPICTLANPLLSLANNQGEEVSAGSSMIYTATVINQNSDSCAVSDFDITAAVPAGWSASNTRVTLASGNSVSVNVDITSATNASDGTYDLSINAQNSADANYSSGILASYSVVTPPAVCVASNPLISLSAPSGTVIAGSTVNYSATVTSLDSSECAAVNFAVFADAQAGWSASDANINLAPGESKIVSISVTSATTTSDGTYNITVNAQNASDSQFRSSEVVDYVIMTPQTPVNRAPVAVNDSVTLLDKEALLIDVLSNDSDPDGDSLIISAVNQGSKGSVQITSDGHLLYTPAKSFKSSDSFSYTISDGDKTATTTVSVSLNSSSGGKGKGKSGK